MLLKILETLWRGILSFALLIVGALIAVAIWSELLEPTLFPPLKSKVEATVRYDDGTAPPPIRIAPAGGENTFEREQFRCDQEYPIEVKFTNKSDKIVGSISFEIEAYKPGYSENVAEFDYLQSDAIIRPGYYYISCWRVPGLPSEVAAENLIYRANITFIDEADPTSVNQIAPSIPAPAPPALLQPSAKNERSLAQKLLTVASGILLVLAFGVGGYCLMQIVTLVGPAALKQAIEHRSGLVFGLATFTNVLLIWLISWPVLSVPPIGEWYSAMDAWSRANGYADGATAGIAALSSLWTVPTYWLLSRNASNLD